MAGRLKKTANASVRTERRPRWVGFLAAVALCLLLVVSVNYKSFAVFERERDQQKELNEKIEDLADENLALQEEIHYLKTDPKKLEPEAKKLGLERKKEVVSKADETGTAEVPANRQSPTNK
ncbi:MAG: septum formation initiator family protein [Acidobacteria bacterium]|nr:septum formation initiator family protein [Acidobacteriota bacterium]